ncbi:MAG: hypothetical protein AAB336_05840 [Acidobacteriota bacterium]
MTNSTSCPVCNNTCSLEATSCPKCGHPFQKYKESSKNRKLKLIGLIVGGLWIVGIVTYVVYSFAFAKSNLNIKAALILNSGNAQPVSRTKFNLVKIDLPGLAKESGLSPSDLNEDNVTKLEESAAKHIIATVTSDFEGKAVFDNVPKGDYIIYCRAGGLGYRHSVVWLFPVKVNGSSEAILLDQNNAFYSFSF